MEIVAYFYRLLSRMCRIPVPGKGKVGSVPGIRCLVFPFQKPRKTLIIN